MPVAVSEPCGLGGSYSSVGPSMSKDPTNEPTRRDMAFVVGASRSRVEGTWDIRPCSTPAQCSKVIDADVWSIWAGAPRQQACLIHDSGKHSVQVSNRPYWGIGLRCSLAGDLNTSSFSVVLDTTCKWMRLSSTQAADQPQLNGFDNA